LEGNFAASVKAAVETADGGKNNISILIVTS